MNGENKMLQERQGSNVKAREIAQVEGQIVLAKRFPRSVVQALEKIEIACARQRFAEDALYSYPRGGAQVEGPSIRMAEMLGQSWQNMEYGIREVESRQGESLMQAFCWDMENNVRSVKEFTVKHVRSKKSGNVDLTDPRDIYEMTANMGARRMRACILSLIPQDIIEDAVDMVNKTLAGKSDEPLIDRIKKMAKAFKKDCGVTQIQIEERQMKKLESVTEKELIELRKIYKSIVDGMSKPEQWFEPEGKAEMKAKADNLAGKKGKKTDEENLDAAESDNPDSLGV